eukprot:449656_1
MAAEQKETEGGAQKNALQTTKQIGLFTMTKYVNINYNNKIIEGTQGDGWRHIGFNHVIQPKEKIIIETMAIAPRISNNTLYFGIGFATKGIINTTGHNVVGKYIQGWFYRCDGWIFSNGKQQKQHIPVALMQKFRVEMEKYKIKIFIANQEITTCDVKDIFNRNKDEQFYPCLSLNGKGCTIQVVDFSIQ